MKKHVVASKILTGALAVAMVASVPGMSAINAKADDQVTISLYTTVPGHDEDFEKFCADFMEANPDITVNYIAYDSSEKQKWMTLYASGEAPTVSLMDAVDIRENIENMAAYDLEGDDSWIKDQVDDSNLAIFKDDNGSVYGVPNSVQSMGIIYNKTTIEKATGEEFDPSTIKSNADLDALCQKIQDGGVSPIMFTGVDWSLGSHFLSQVFNGIQGDEDAQKAFVEGIKDGSIDLKTIIVHDDYQIVQLSVACEHGSLPYLTLLDLAVAQQCVYTIAVAGYLCGKRHADCCGDALSQRSAGHIKTRCVLHTGMSLKM